MARKPKNVENEAQTLYDLESCEKHWKTWIMKNHTVGHGLWRETLKNVENETQTAGIWREIIKKRLKW